MFKRNKAEPKQDSGVQADDSVLDELSRAFGIDGSDGGDGAEAGSDVTEPSPADVLAIADGRSAGSPVTESGGGANAQVGSILQIGTDDEFPDAVYLDEELGRGDSSDGTVFIDDDGTGDAIAPKEASPPGIEPRIRQRRIGVRRAENRRRLKWVGLTVVVLIILLGVLTLLGSGLFAVDNVAVGGDVYIDRDRLDAVVDDLMGTPVLLVDTAEAEAELEAIAWVEDARVRTKFPNRVTIEIRERAPVATMRGSDGLFRVLDAEGRVLDVIEGQPVAYALIAGPGTLDLAAGEFAPVGQAWAASLVTKFTPRIRPRVHSLEVGDDGSVLVVNLSPLPANGQSGTIRVRFGSAIGDSDQIEKLVRLEKHLDDISDGSVSEIDVSTDEVTVV